MGVLRPLGKSRTLPPMPQQACADKADGRDHGGSDERRHAEAQMAKSEAVICPEKNDEECHVIGNAYDHGQALIAVFLRNFQI